MKDFLFDLFWLILFWMAVALLIGIPVYIYFDPK